MIEVGVRHDICIGKARSCRKLARRRAGSSRRYGRTVPQRPQNECTHGRARSRASTGTAPVHPRGCSQNQFFLDALNPYERSFQSAAPPLLWLHSCASGRADRRLWRRIGVALCEGRTRAAQPPAVCDGAVGRPLPSGRPDQADVLRPRQRLRAALQPGVGIAEQPEWTSCGQPHVEVGLLGTGAARVRDRIASGLQLPLSGHYSEYSARVQQVIQGYIQPQ